MSGKLVRDRIPDIITDSGAEPQATVLADDRAYRAALIGKLHEEAAELAGADRPDDLAELSDLHEVLAALTAHLGYTPEQVVEAAAAKRAERGGFQRRIWLAAGDAR